MKTSFFGRLSVKLEVGTEESTYISVSGAGEEIIKKRKKKEKRNFRNAEYLF